jgi:2-polyprenyl-3-methyl-5-hydroxy-6-metoxy-1,4-benzoquinol methylase
LQGQEQCRAEIALRSGNSSRCAAGATSAEETANATSNSGNSASEKADTPADAAEFSLGRGNPFGMAGLRAGETVLDIGYGEGIDVFLAARQVGATGFVFGVDMTPAMLECARKSAETGGYANVDFRQGYVEKLLPGDVSARK